MTRAGGWTLMSGDRLTAGQVAEVLTLAGAVARVDGAEPLNEDALLHLPSIAAGRHHRVVGTDGDLLGYAQVRAAGVEAGSTPEAGSTADSGSTLEVVVGLTERESVATTLFTAAETAAGGDLLVWSRGADSPVGRTALARGYREDRVLLTMGRPVAAGDTDALPAPPEGVTIRSFVPGQDEAQWLTVNARAFAGHPEQGRWTAADLADRLAQSWFDPAGFFLAVDEAGMLLGFHWTKHHGGPPDGRTVGEVYVIGLDPRAQGRGLGRLLLRTGLRHLARAGADQVTLYSDESNRGAVALYRSTGFEVLRREIQYRRGAGLDLRRAESAPLTS